MCLEAGTAEVVSEAVVYRTVREIIFQWKIMASKQSSAASHFSMTVILHVSDGRRCWLCGIASDWKVRADVQCLAWVDQWVKR